MSSRVFGLALGAATLLSSMTAQAADAVPQNDNLNAQLWIQRSVEFKANSEAIYALARIRQDQALADTKWTAAPEQTGAFAAFPPAVILDLDETVLDNSPYETGLIPTNTDYSSKTWDNWVRVEQARAVPGSLDFTKYADSKGVKIFYVSNRTADQAEPTKHNMQALGFPMGGNVDTFLMSKGQPDWGSAKGTRRTFIAKDYRILLEFGDNFCDFTDKCTGSEADRLASYNELKSHFGHDWLMIANPGYGSFESAPFESNYKLSSDERRAKKVGVLETWIDKGAAGNRRAFILSASFPSSREAERRSDPE